MPDINSYSIGPFHIDLVLNRITMAPGVYRLTEPITFGLTDDTIVSGVTCGQPENGAGNVWIGTGSPAILVYSTVERVSARS